MTTPSRLQLRPRGPATSPSPAALGADVPWRLAAAVGALVVLATSFGDGFVPAALLGLAAGAWPGLGAGLVFAATVARWGTADLAAIAGDQDVLGPGVAVGSVWAAASSVLAAAALVLIAPTARARGVERLAIAAAAGVGAATLAAGPAATSGADVALRIGASVVGVGLALVLSTSAAGRRVPPWLPAVVGSAAFAGRAGVSELAVRTGPWWDALAVVALLLPFVGLGVRLTGSADRQSIVAAGRAGAFGAAVLWVVAVAAGAAPDIGPLEPEPLAMAAAGGAALLATAEASVLAAPLAGLIGLLACVVSPPTSSGTLHLAVGAAVVVVSVLIPAPARVLVAAALLVGLRGASAGDPSDAVGLALAAAAAAFALLDVRGVTLRSGPRDRAGWATAALGVGALAVATAPVPEARSGAVLLAVAVVLLAATGSRWALLAALPGAAMTATALADLPAVDAPSPVVHVAFAVLLVGVGAGIVAAAFDEDRPPETRALAAVLAAWLAVTPSSWGWAVPDSDVLVPWDRAAAVAVAVAAATVVADQGRRRARH